MKLDLIKLYESKIVRYFESEGNYLYLNECEYNEERMELSFAFQNLNEKYYVTKTLDELSELITSKILTKQEIQKVGNILAEEIKGSYLYFENNKFVIDIKRKKHFIEKTNIEIIDILNKNKDITIIPKMTVRKVYKNEEYYTLGGTLERRKYKYKLKDYTENNTLYEVPSLFYAEGLKRWFECMSHFEKDEFKLILSNLK